MRDQLEFKLHKTPFFIGDLMLLGAAFFIYFQSKLPMGAWQIFFIVLCVAGGPRSALCLFCWNIDWP